MKIKVQIKNIFLFAIILSFTFLFSASCKSLNISSRDGEPETRSGRTGGVKTGDRLRNRTTAEPEQYSLTLIAVGDNLLHESTMKSGLTEEGLYNFIPFYSEIKPIVEKADLAFINQETVMAGTSFGYSGYPAFNSPRALATAIVDAGFDVINLANNHAMDKGTAGLIATLDYLDTIKEITVIGARKQGESARIISANNIKLGFLSYTHTLNGITLPANNPNLVSLNNKDTMSREINALRPLCDFLIVSMHWGDEYILEPNNSQIDYAQFLAELNVDLIIGHHPHVLQKAEYITLPNGRKTLCYYSLGNFVSHQNLRERVIGGMAVVTINKKELPFDDDDTEALSAAETIITENNKRFLVSISDFGIMPLVTHFDQNLQNTKVYPLYSYSKELAEDHAVRKRDSNLTMDFFHNVTERLKAKVILSNPFDE